MSRPPEIPATHSSTDEAVAALERLSSGVDVVERGGIGEAVEFFRRASMSERSGGGGRGPEKPFEQVEAVHRCVMMLINSMYQMPIMVGTDKDQIIETGPIADLVARANAGQSLADVIADLVGWVLLSGRAHLVYTEMESMRPKAMVAVGKPQMRPVCAGGPHDETGELLGWLYRKPGQRWDQATALPLDQVWTITLRSFNPDRPYDGLAIADVVRRKINQVYKADVANERSLDHDMRMSAVISPEEPVTPEHWKEFVDQLREQNEGYLNRNRILATSRKVNVQPQSASFADMEFTGLLDRSVASICVAFGFDPSAVGYPPAGGRFEFVKAAKASAWLDTIIPFACWIADELNRGPFGAFERDASLTWSDARKKMQTRGMTHAERSSIGRRRAVGNGTGIVMWFDESRIPAVREAKLALAKEGAVFIQAYKATPAEVNDLFDLGLPTHPWQEVAWQTFSEMVIDPAAPGKKPGANDPAGPAPEDLDDPAPAPGSSAGEGDDSAAGDNSDGTKSRSVPDYVRRISQAQLANLHQQWRASWSVIEQAWQSRHSRHVYELRGQVLANLERLAPPEPPPEATPANDPGAKAMAVIRRDLIGEILFDLIEADQKLLARVGPLIRASYQLGGDQSMNEAAKAEGKEKPDLFRIADPAVERRMRQREIRVKETNRTLRRRLADSMAEGVGQQETISQIAERVRKEFNFAGTRAATIARTEVGGAVEDARHEGRRQAGVPGKSWLWSRKETGRPWHMEEESITLANPIPNDALFELPQTGAQTPYPRGPGLTAEDAANCGCTTIARYPNDQVRDARLIAHYFSRGFLLAAPGSFESPSTETA